MCSQPSSTVTTIVSLNPATEEPIGEVPNRSSFEVSNAVEAARQAQPSWHALGFKERGRVLLCLRDAIRDAGDSLAELISRENGKPLPEAMAEIFSTCEFLVHYARHSERILRDQPIQVFNPLLRNAKTYTTFVPKGVVGIISPWNYPLLIPMASISGALAAGNTVVQKPSEWTPLVMSRIEELARKAGMPEGVFQVVTGDGSTGSALVEAPIHHLCFTGSVSTGRKVARRCADKLVSVTLELGGKDPALVLSSADLAFTARGVVWGAFSNAGQTCAAVERLYVERRFAPELIEWIVERVKQLRVGEWHEPEVEIGPVINHLQLAKIEAQVEEAVAKGAKVLTGGHRLDRKGYFYAPTVLTGVTEDMLIMREETFGPVLPILETDGVEEMIRATNQSSFGLSASVWGRDLQEAEKVACRLEVGTAWVNTGLDSYANPVTQRGGLKESGIGRIGGAIGLLELVDAKLIDINRSGRYRLFWYPVWSGCYDFIKGAMECLHETSLSARISGVLHALRHWPKTEAK